MKPVDKSLDEIKKYLSIDYFKERGWYTPAQIRDDVVEFIYGHMTDLVNEARKLGIEETERRKVDPNYIKCARCFGYHEQKNNIDGLCEICEAATAPFRFDKKK
jgi:hypothetical protein